MRTWVTADEHFGHRNIIKYCSRPYFTIEEMNADYVRRWNVDVAPKDTVYVVGDFAMNKRQFVAFNAQTNGKKVFIAGNHDPRHVDGVTFVPWVFLKHGGNTYFMAHYPHQQWQSSHYGSIHLHGHSHGTFLCDESLRRLDVSVDAIRKNGYTKERNADGGVVLLLDYIPEILRMN